MNTHQKIKWKKAIQNGRKSIYRQIYGYDREQMIWSKDYHYREAKFNNAGLVDIFKEHPIIQRALDDIFTKMGVGSII